MAVRLEPYRGGKTRHRCPKCGRSREFTRYIDENGEYIFEDVGKCNKEDSCGYHKKPKDHFLENPRSEWTRELRNQSREPDKPTDYLPHELLTQTMRGYERNNFLLFLWDLIGEDSAREQMRKYHVGTSIHWQGGNVFWQVDINGKVRQLKLMVYNKLTGKRIKKESPAMKWDYISETYRVDVGGQDKSLIYGKFIQGGKFQDLNLKQCFYGEDLLRNKGRVAIVESEKTAIVSDHYLKEKEYIWLATGGSNGAGFTKPEVCRVLKDREIILFPDLGKFDKWTEKAREIQRIIPCKIIVSDLLEANARPEDKARGLDIADYLIANNDPLSQSKKSLPDKGGHWVPIDGMEGF